MQKSTKNDKHFYFFIGTEAELIKLLPVLLEFQKRKVPYTIIASGQNDITKSKLFRLLEATNIRYVLFSGNIMQTPAGLLVWFITTTCRSLVRLRKEFSHSNKKNTYMIVHGDTVSSVMGALLGKMFGLTVVHIEAGLRSYNYMHPFPEEIDRSIVSRLAQIHFCPNEWAVKNLVRVRGKKVNTEYNTLIESLEIALQQKTTPEVLRTMGKKKYFVFVMHRQENLLNSKLVQYLVKEFLTKTTNIECIFIQHEFTKVRLEKLGLLNLLQENKHIHLTPRLSYIDFMKVLKNCEYVITDGGSNQEECYYLGKPTLLLRHATERIEGIGENVVLSKNNIDIITNFIANHRSYRRKSVHATMQPSKIIIEYMNTLV